MIAPSRIVLVGFMGSGKSTVGGLLAATLGYRSIDSDLELAREAGFATPGEALTTLGEARFREAERNAIRAILAGDGLVLATGGGAFAEEETAELLLDRGFVVHLQCDLAEAVRRAARRGGRPLLAQGPDAVAQLFAARKDKYARAHAAVDTTGVSPAQVTQAILDRLPR